MAIETVTEAIVARLADAGVRHIFGVPGGECNLDFIAAADKLGIRFILTRTETSAVMMACVAGELTGTVGVAMTTRGPGLAAAANGVAYADLDRAALLLIADGYEDDQGAISHQRIDQAAILAPMTKATSFLREDPLGEVERLLAAATAQPPGPVYLEVSGSRIRGEAPQAIEPVAAMVAGPDTEALEHARALIAGARRPLVLAGLQARRPDAAERLRAFITATGTPVMTTYKAKGVAADDDALTLGHYMGGVEEQAAIRAADLLILYGFDPVEGPPQPWRYHDMAMLELTEHAYEFPLFQATVSVVGDIAGSLDALQPALGQNDWAAPDLAGFKDRIAAAPRVPMGPGISPQQLVDAAQAALPRDCRITIDAGAHMLPVLHLWQSSEPSQSLISRGLSTMGFALPAAIASSLADPARRTVAFTGDGGLMMCVGELGTAIQYGASPIVVVFNDSSLTLIGAKQRRRQLAAAGVDFSTTDFAQVARGFGWRGIAVDDAAALPEAFAQAMAEDGPVLIDVRINPEEYHAQIRAVRG